jgi:hypothetical protein
MSSSWLLSRPNHLTKNGQSRRAKKEWVCISRSTTPVPGDYDGDGKNRPRDVSPSNGTWYILKSSTNYARRAAQRRLHRHGHWTKGRGRQLDLYIRSCDEAVRLGRQTDSVGILAPPLITMTELPLSVASLLSKRRAPKPTPKARAAGLPPRCPSRARVWSGSCNPSP